MSPQPQSLLLQSDTYANTYPNPDPNTNTNPNPDTATDTHANTDSTANSGH
jgi:hypothetical protein